MPSSAVRHWKNPTGDEDNERTEIGSWNLSRLAAQCDRDLPLDDSEAQVRHLPRLRDADGPQADPFATRVVVEAHAIAEPPSSTATMVLLLSWPSALPGVGSVSPRHAGLIPGSRSPIRGPTVVTSGIGCRAHSGGLVPWRSAAMRAK